MFKFFETIINLISSVVSYFINFIKQLGMVIASIGKAIVQITGAFGLLPAYLVVFCTAVIFVSIVFFLINR